MKNKLLSAFTALCTALFTLPAGAATAEPYTRWETFVTVYNADTDAPLAGAHVSHIDEAEFPEGHLTDENGALYCLLPDGNQTLTVTLTGYDVLEQPVTIRKSHKNEINLYILPTRQTAKMPSIQTRGGKPVTEPRVTVERISAAATNAWNNGNKALEIEAGTQTELPPGEFKITNATYGTFGLKYDTNLFEFDPATGFELDSALKLKYTPESMYGDTWSNENGYFIFVWQASGDDDTEFKTEGTAKHVATL